MARDISKVMLHADAVRYFEEEMMPGIRDIEATQSGNPDWPRRCEAWSNWVDSLCKGREISDWQQENWSMPPSCD